jgi:pheromone shutdown-related protein TraB
MIESDLLPKSVERIQLAEKEIYVVGTAHVSAESVEDVKATIDAVGPDSICIELCAARHKALVQKDNWKKMDIFKVIKEKRALFLLAQLILNSFYIRLGKQLKVQPGAEMIEGMKLAEKTGAELVLADRDIEVTLKRVWGYLNLWNKLVMVSQLMASFFVGGSIDSELVEEMKSKDQLENIMEAFTDSFPEVKKRLIDERDIYLSQKIRIAPGKKIVAIVGAGHVKGIKEHIKNVISLEPIMEIPPKSVIPQILKWVIPLLIVVLLVVGFFKGGAEHSVESIYIWILVNGILAAAGTAIAFGHPITILSAFVGAPITSLNPMIAAGWVAGLVQAWIKKPTVRDFEDLPNAISSVKGFWLNPVSRILLVVVLANLGSTFGTIISGIWIAERTL